jgi:hypothetical protein
MRPLLACLLVSSVTTSAFAQDRCGRDELVVELPPAPPSDAPRATVVLAYSGGDPYSGPSRGVCLRRAGAVEHIPSGTVRRVEVLGSRDELLEMRVGLLTLHVSMPPESVVELLPNACTPWRLDGPDLDWVDWRGERRATAAHLELPDGSTVPAQRGWCAPYELTAGDRVHAFWLRGGERWRVRIEGERVVGTPIADRAPPPPESKSVSGRWRR